MMHAPIHPPLQTQKRGVAVALEAVRRVFDGGLVAVSGMDLHIPAGQFVALLGPSGCGKSTLLRMIAGLDYPNAGTITLRNANTLTQVKQPGSDRSDRNGVRIAYVFQDAQLLPWRNVLRNVALPLELQGVSRAERHAAATEAIAQVGLAEFATRYPAQLSGGMRMRVSLARALVTNPDLLLLDEPFAALDEITRASLDLQLRQLWQTRRMTVIFVTHSITEAAFLAERAVVLTRRPARIVLDHTISLPAERSNTLRGEPAFARETGVLLDALEKGEAFE